MSQRTRTTDRFEGSHSEEIGHHRTKSRCQTRLGDKAQLQFRQTDNVVTLFPVPRWNV